MILSKPLLAFIIFLQLSNPNNFESDNELYEKFQENAQQIVEIIESLKKIMPTIAELLYEDTNINKETI